MKNKKLFLIISLLVCVFTCFFTACGSDNIKPDYSADENPVEKTVVINGFDRYDDIKMFAIDTEAFSGRIRVNNDTKYIKSGSASMEVYFQSIGPNNPYLPVYASNLGLSNITKVKNFGLYIYNPGNSFTFGFVAKNAEDVNVYSKQIEVASGENKIDFITDLGILQYIGKSVFSYQFQFIGVTPGATVYLDELYAVTTTKTVEPIKEIDNIISSISNLDTSNKEEVYKVFEQYKALKNEYKVAINSYRVLKHAVDEFFMVDLIAARRENPETLLFFNEPFGEAQIEDVTSVLTASYSTEWAAEGESGSLKIESQESNINWVSVRTTAKVDINDFYISFTVKNDSDQRKMLTLNWRGEWILPANSETTIVCKSTLLTRSDSGTAGGYIHYCGLVDDTWAAEYPKGAIYISAIKSRAPDPAIQAMRTGDDTNTLFFFDRAIGQDMVMNASAGLSYEFSTEKAYGDENGSLKISFNSSTDQSTIDYLTEGYVSNTGDYVYFNAYNDSTSIIQLMVEYRDGIRLKPGKWTEILIPIEEIDNYSYFRFWSLENNLSGSVYLSKAKVISGEGIEVLSNKAGNSEWAFGNLDLQGPLSYENYSQAQDDSKTLTNPLGYAPYLFQNNIYVNFMEYGFGRIYFNLKNCISMTEDRYFELTVKNDSRLDDMVLFGSTEMDEWVYSWVPYEEKLDLGNGYTKYLYCLSVYPGVEIKSIIIQPIRNSDDAMQFVLKDIRSYTFEQTESAGWNQNSIRALRTGDDAYTLVFSNLEVGVQEQFNNNSALNYSYDTDRRYGTEEGSLKVMLLDSDLATIQCKLFGAKYTEANDRVVFNVYLDRATSMYLFVGDYEVELLPNKWNRITIDANVFFSNRMLNFYQGDGHKNASIYISKIILINMNEKLSSMRTGADSRTVLFFDKEFGAEWQVGSWSNASYEYTTEKAYGTETGSLKVSNINIDDWSADSALGYNVLGMDCNANDWVVYHAYLANAEKPIVILSGWGGAYILMPNTWTQIAIPAEEFFAREFRFYKFYAGNTGDEIIYISKVYLTDEVIDLSNYTESDTYMIGETEFKKAPPLYNGTHDDSLFATLNGKDLLATPLLIDDELVVTRYGMAAWSPFMWLYLNESIEVESGDVLYLTLDYYDSVTLSTMYFNESEKYSLSLQATTDLGNGYKRNVYKMIAGANGTLTNLRFDCGETGQFRIKGIAISNTNPS